jgi:hypothetical protein
MAVFRQRRRERRSPGSEDPNGSVSGIVEEPEFM